jgi:hypothetical protein
MNNRRNPMARDLRQPKYKTRVVPDKKKPRPVRKEKHKGKDSIE